MTSPSRFRMSAYLLGLVATAAVAAFLAVACPFTLANFENTMKCSRRGAGPDTALTYCQSPEFNDFEIGGFYYGLEPEMIGAMRRADVVFFGNSFLSFAVATPLTEPFFRRKAASFFVGSFNYGPNGAFFDRLVRKWNIHPRIAVIAVDRFFENRVEGPIPVIDDHPWTMAGVYLWKDLFRVSQKWLCALDGSVCDDSVPAFYRVKSNGLTDLRAVPNRAQAKVAIETGKLTKDFLRGNPDEASILSGARRFLDALATEKSCVVLVSVPNPDGDNRPLAIQLAQSLRVKAVAYTDGLYGSFDGRHLAAESAQQWSANVLGAIEPTIEACLRR